jgi:hypothetical protein
MPALFALDNKEIEIMPARFFNVYIRRAEAPFSSFNLAANPLDGDLNDWDRLELLADKPKIGLDPVNTPLGDGNQYSGAEKLQFEGGTMQVSKVEWEYLRTAFHNQLCDVLMYDPTDDSFIIAAFGLKLVMTLIVESGTMQTIKVTGERTTSTDAASKLLLGTNTYACQISGKVTLLDGVTPVVQAVVTITLTSPARAYTDTTDKDGNYQMMVEVPNGSSTNATFTSVVKAGKAFTLPSPIVVNRNGEYVQNVLATT